MLQSGILTFPDDEGRHRDAETEWWYFNGHVEAEDGNRVSGSSYAKLYHGKGLKNFYYYAFYLKTLIKWG